MPIRLYSALRDAQGAYDPPPEPEWLGIGPDPSVDYTRTLPTGSSVIYVATDGNDTTGDGSEGNPYQTIAKGITEVSSGANNGVVIRGGTYNEKDLSLNKSGTAGNKLKVMAYPGETVKVSRLYDLSGGWTTHNSSLKQYNSVLSVSESGAEVGGVFRWTGPDGLDEWWGLGPYKNLATFNDSVSNYAGPGVRAEGGKIRIRIQHPVQSFTTLPDAIWTWDENDPGSMEFMIFPDDGADCFHITGNHVELNGIEMLGYTNLIRLDACNNIDIINCYGLFRRVAIALSGSAGSIHHLLTDKFDIQGCGKTYYYLPSRWFKILDEFDMDHHAFFNFQPAPYNDIEMRNCTMLGLVNGARLAGRSTRIRIHHNYIADQNDGAQTDGTVEEVEFDHNFWRGCHWGPQSSSTSNFPGRVWIHHEIIDNTFGQLFWPGDFADWPVHIRHVGSATWDGYPIKMWNCTILQGDGVSPSEGGTIRKPGISYLNDGQNTTGVSHDIFNNIVVILNTGPGRSGGDYYIQFLDHYDADQANDDTTSRFDGCCYWRTDPSPGDIFVDFKPNKTVGGSEDYASLAAWKASGSFTTSKQHYSPGWHNSSFEEDPNFVGPIDYKTVANYMPQNSKCATDGISLVSIKDSWPGQANIQSREGLDSPITYVGALDPAA